MSKYCTTDDELKEAFVELFDRTTRGVERKNVIEAFVSVLNAYFFTKNDRKMEVVDAGYLESLKELERNHFDIFAIGSSPELAIAALCQNDELGQLDSVYDFSLNEGDEWQWSCNFSTRKTNGKRYVHRTGGKLVPGGFVIIGY